MPCAKRAIKSCSHSVAGRMRCGALKLGRRVMTGAAAVGAAGGMTRQGGQGAVFDSSAVTRHFGQRQNVTD